jgi:AcrR family transcriptional regulator
MDVFEEELEVARKTTSTAKRRTQAERSEATRGALVAAARPLFGKRGYADVGTEEIVRAAGVTRGALYHQFPGGKRDLFEAVYEAVETDLTARVVAHAGRAGDPLGEMRVGASLFLKASLEPDVQRIVLLDGPAVLGWERWREIAAEHGLGVITAVIAAAIEAGQIPKQPPEPLAHLLMGALDEAALLVARAEDQRGALAEMVEALSRMLDGLETKGR